MRMVRRTGEQTRTELTRVAADKFRLHGYRSVTLEDIADEVGVTRAAVLHYFGSKAELLATVVRPFMSALDSLLDRVEAAGQLRVRQQRAFFAQFVDVLCEHRAVAALLVRDVNTHEFLAEDMQIVDRAARFARIVSQNGQSRAPAVGALSALGAVLRPVAAPDELVDLTRPENRQILVECAVAALRASMVKPAVLNAVAPSSFSEIPMAAKDQNPESPRSTTLAVPTDRSARETLAFHYADAGEAGVECSFGVVEDLMWKI